MLNPRPLLQGPISVTEFVCSARPGARAYPEAHRRWSLSYVQRGTFGCRCGSRHHELVPGAVLRGRPADEYTCSHVHHDGGDACLAVFGTRAARG
jgi:hypothetical protein